MRTYKKRTKTTSAKTYQDYLRERQILESKGYVLKDKMSLRAFTEYYEKVRIAKRVGEIKSQPWQYLMSKERYLSRKQAKTFAIADTEIRREQALYDLMQRKDTLSPSQFTKELNKINKIETKIKDTYSFNKDKVAIIGGFINRTKDTGVYGGDYE